MTPLRLALGTVAGAFLGAACGLYAGAAYVVPDTLDTSRWSVVIPGRDESVVTPEQGRGAQIVGGALVLTPHVFQRADHLSPKDTRPVAAVHLELAPGSGPARLIIRDEAGIFPLSLAPDAWRRPPQSWTPHEGAYDIRIADGKVWVGDAVAGNARPSSIELAVEDAEVRITALSVTATDGTVILQEDPVGAWRGRAPVLPGAALGALIGLALAAAGTSLPGALLLVVIPISLGFVPHQAWLALVERLYLARLTTWDLARLALGVSLLPVGIQLLAGLRVAMPDHRPRDARALWLAGVGVASVLASRTLSGVELALAPVGALVLLSPVAFARAARLDPQGLFLRDLPALLAPAALGWGPGLFLTVAWRLALLVAGAGLLLRRAPRAAADALFASGLALLPAAELGARSTWLDTAWDAERLEGSQVWRNPPPSWAGECGESPRKSVLFAGGSSTGGAYQFLGEPEAFFAGRTHARMCANGVALRTSNYGGGGRDSFTISRSIDTLLAREHPDVVVLYLGVNDLLTHDNPLTRKQREALEESRGAAARGLAGIASRSRLLTGVGLLLRPEVDTDASMVPDVPIADAEENLRRIATAVTTTGARLLLTAEYTEGETARQVAPYATLEARLAGEIPGVSFTDVSAGLAPYAGEGLLLDRNHLSHKGSERLAEVLAPEVTALLGR